MFEALFDPLALLYASFAMSLLGAMVRDQVILRIFFTAAAITTMAYFLLHPAGQNWTLIALSGTIAIVHGLRITRMILDRRIGLLSEDERQLMRAFGSLSAGQLRRLMRGAKWYTSSGETRLTTEGEVPDGLYYVASGNPSIDKGGRRFEVESGLFIGEIAWLLGTKASASVTLPAGARYVAWDGRLLAETLRSEPELKEAMGNILNRDLARKLGTG